jgi:uncharacterized protein (TIGR02145 family)
MKTKNRIWISPLAIIMGLLCLASFCEKENDNNNPTTVIDKDGNVYTSVTIGTQVWMVENLKTTKYRNGDLIGATTPSTLDITSDATPKYQWAYGGDEGNVSTYGRLYTWYAVTDPRNVCPTGWHLPTNAEWTTMTTYLGGGEVAGGKLKEIGTTHWITPNTGATNENGFTALPGGYRESNGIFGSIGTFGYWWSSSEAPSPFAFGRLMANGGIFVSNLGFPRQYGLSVRCLKDN